MTSESVFRSFRICSAARWRSITADLAFWTVVGVIVAALSRPLAQWWGLPQAVLLDGGVAFAVLGPGLLLGLSRMRPTPRGLVWGFGISNLVLAPLLWAAAELR